MTRSDSLIWASGFFLTNYLPQGFDEWSEAALDEFVEENISSAYEEDWNLNEVWREMSELAYAALELYEEAYAKGQRAPAKNSTMDLMEGRR